MHRIKSAAKAQRTRHRGYIAPLPYPPTDLKGLAYLRRGRGGSEEWGRGQGAADPGGGGAIAPVGKLERISERIQVKINPVPENSL